MMVSISVKDVEHVAKLARLELQDSEKELYTEQLNSILGYMEILNRVDTSDVKPMEHVLPLKNVLREDEVGQTLDKELALSNAPQQENGCFRVPKIV